MKLGLGTAQFGLGYGITNVEKTKTPLSEIWEIIKIAHSSGVDTVDTAFEYGDSEQVLGEIGASSQFKTVTKTAHEARNLSCQELRESFFSSLKRLNCERVYSLLLHREDDLLVNKEIYPVLKKLKEEGYVQKIGVSFYEPDVYFKVTEKFELDIMQVPFSVFDQDFFISGALKNAKTKGIEVHTRSTFLQGLPFKEDSFLKSKFAPVYQKIEAFKNEALERGISIQEALIKSVVGFDEIDKMIVGFQGHQEIESVIPFFSETLENFSKEEIGKFNFNNAKFSKPSNWNFL